MLRILNTTVLLFFAFWLQGAVANPLIYDEAVNGDIEWSELQFDVGVNTVKGVMHFIDVYENGIFVKYDQDADVFGFSIPTGTFLTSGRLEAQFSNTTNHTVFFEVGWNLLLDDGTPVNTPCITFLGTPQPSPPCNGTFTGGSLFTGLALSDSHYVMGNPSYAGWGGPPPFFETTSGGYVDYEISFGVQSVPEPETFILMAIGLAVISLRFRSTDVLGHRPGFFGPSTGHRGACLR